MGVNLNASFVELLTHFHSYKDFRGKSCLMLGVQYTGMNAVYFQNYAAKVGFELDPAFSVTNRMKFRILDSYSLFRWIGFSEVQALDVSDYEGADIIFDLNYPVPKDFHDKFDLIYDGGTIEHIFDIRQVMENLVQMVKIDGIILHDLAAAKMCNHGFYSFSPTMFVDFYTANGFRINTIRLFARSEVDYSVIQYNSVDCRVFDPLKFLSKKLDQENEIVFIVCMATKVTNKSDITVPIQSLYRERHHTSEKKYKSELEYTFEYVKNKVYHKVAVYGMGLNALVLYDMFSDCESISTVYIVRGEKEDNKSLPMKYNIVSEIPNDVDCVVIGSFKYADIIQSRLEKNANLKKIEIINMLDI